MRRYLRLYIPVAFTLILAYVLMISNVYSNVPVAAITHSEWWFGGMWTFKDPFKVLLWCLSRGTMFGGDGILDTSMWTLSLELYNSFFVFGFLALTHKMKRRFLALLLMVCYCYTTDNGILLCFVLGMLLNYIDLKKVRLKKGTAIVLGIFLLLFGLLLGSYPTGGSPKSTIFAGTSPFMDQFAVWYHPLGAFALITAFVISSRLQRFVSLRFFRFLGYISFSIYLLHPIIMGAFSSYLFLRLYKSMNYNLCVAKVLAATTLVCFGLSWLMARYIDGPGVRLSAYIYERFFKNKVIAAE